MNTDDLIKHLRRVAAHGTTITPSDKELFAKAADRLEEQEERLAIMAANMDEAWGRGHG